MSAVALITDLMFTAKVKGTADLIGLRLKVVRDLSVLSEEIAAGVDLAIIDMNADGVDTVEAIRRCKSAPQPPAVLAYLSHVQKDLADAANAAGADLVLPRSRFSAELPELLRRFANRP